MTHTISKNTKKNNYTRSSHVSSIVNFIAHISPISDAQINAVVEFENKELGIIWQIGLHTNVVLLLTPVSLVTTGMKVRIVASNFSIYADERLLGRIVDPLLSPRDNKPLVSGGKPQPVFGIAPSFFERAIVDEQLETGVMIVDTLFPIVKGQRIAIIGDNKTGKTTFLTQIAQAQRQQDAILVYVLIGKKTQDINFVLTKLKDSGVLDKTVVVLADAFDGPVLGYLAPFVGCAIAESYWRAGKNTIIFYDDMSTHAKTYREMSLLMDVPVGREAYPGDMFWQHASLLERAGRLKRNGASQTAIAVSTAPTGDLSGFLPTSLISMTDGQIVFDLASLHKGIHPAVNVGISVSRVGGRSQSKNFAKLSSRIKSQLAKYRDAKNYARFGSEPSDTTQQQIELGDKLYELFSQSPAQIYNLKEQYLLIETVMQSKDIAKLNIPWLKSVISDVASQEILENDYVKIARELAKSNPVMGRHE